MQGLSEDNSKFFIEIGGRPLVAWQVDALRAAEIEEVRIVTGYRRATLITFGLHEFHNAKWSTTNMVTSPSCAAEWLREGPCVIPCADIFYESSAVTSLMQAAASLAVAYDPAWLTHWRKRLDDPLLDAESFRLNDDGSTVEVGASVTDISDLPGQCMGLLLVSPEAWCEIELIRGILSVQEGAALDMTSLLQRVIQRKSIRLDAVRYEGIWGEVDKSSDIHVSESHEFGIAPALYMDGHRG